MKKRIVLIILIISCGSFVFSASKSKKKVKSKQLEESVSVEQKTGNQPISIPESPVYSVQVVMLDSINLSSNENAWLPGQVQDKLKSNLQDYLDMRIIADSKTEKELKKLQAESESSGRDEGSAIELGKIVTAKYALFAKLRKTENGYTVSADFTDLTTGEHKASCISEEYSKSEYLYGNTGAIDLLTIQLAEKLGIPISDLNKNRLISGSASFSVDEQLALAKQNEEQFKKMMAKYDAELLELNVSNDISVIENKNKIEAEKALLIEKQNAEKKREEELIAQKNRLEQDAKLEAERSIALKTQRDALAKQASEKAAEVRKLKLEKQGVLGQINVIESKKKAIVEIRQGVESNILELYDSLKKQCVDEENKIRNREYTSVELENDIPTQAAKRRRENQIWANYEKYATRFFNDSQNIRKAASIQDSTLLQEIRNDQKSLTIARVVSSMGDELKVSYGTYSGDKNGWNAYISLYSEGVLLYQDAFIVNYEAITGKKAVNLETENNESLIDDYIANVDMYNSLLSRGDPIIYFEIEYTVKPQLDEKSSEYEFNFGKIRVINTLSGKTVQTSNLNKIVTRSMQPKYDLRLSQGIVETSKKTFEQNVLERNRLKAFQSNGLSDERIDEIYNKILTPQWINSMAEDVFNELLVLARDNKDISKVFFKGTHSNSDTIKYVLIPNGVTVIDEFAFRYCWRMQDVIIPKTVEIIDDQAFYKCSSLRTITIPSSVSRIEASCFQYCSSLKSITINKSVKYIGASVFSFCDSLQMVNYTGTKEDWEKIKCESSLRNIKINFNYKGSN